MTGGTVYCHLDLEMGFNREALRRRLAQGAGVEIRGIEEDDVLQLEMLLAKYHRELIHTHQDEEAEWVAALMGRCTSRFVKIVPEHVNLAPKWTE
jgi:glutamate synthase (NADPH/NADH) large chain